MLHDLMCTFFELLKRWLKCRFKHPGLETLFEAVLRYFSDGGRLL
jgi:hypothetical protein